MQTRSAPCNARGFLTFADTAAIADGLKMGRSRRILVVCSSSRVHKCQKITNTQKDDYVAAPDRKYPENGGWKGV